MTNTSINRVEIDLSWWRDKERTIDNVFTDLAPNVKMGSAYKKARLEYFLNVRRRYLRQRATLTPEEHFSLSLLKDAIKVHWRQLYPQKWKRGLFKLAAAIKHVSKNAVGVSAQGKLGHFEQREQQRSQNRLNLHETLRKAGFEHAIVEVDRQLSQGRPEFQVPLSFFIDNGKSAEYDLHFRKAADGVSYDFEKYDAHLRFENTPGLNRSRSFKVSQGEVFTAKEAHNLLTNRAVLKTTVDSDGNHLPAWVQLNFNQRDNDGQFALTHMPPGKDFNLEAALSKLPLYGMNDGLQRLQMVNELKEGALVSAFFENGNLVTPIFITASPMNGELQLFNQKMKPITTEQLFNSPPLSGQSANLNLDGWGKTLTPNESKDKKLNNRSAKMSKVPSQNLPRVKISPKNRKGLGLH